MTRRDDYILQQLRYSRIRRLYGQRALFKEAWEDTKKKFSDWPWWRKILEILRLCITLPLIFIMFTVVFIIVGVIYIMIFPVILVREYFWQTLAVVGILLLLLISFKIGAL